MEEIDIMEEYAKNPLSLLGRLNEIAAGTAAERIKHLPTAFDLDAFPSSAHCNKIVSVYGTVLKLGCIKFRREKEKRVDYQEIRIQERSNIYLPQTITVQLENDLVDSCKPGEVLRISGIVKILWNRVKVAQPIDCEYTILALSVTKQVPIPPHDAILDPEEEYAILMETLKNMAPKMVGCLESKLGLLLCAIGGQGKKEERPKAAEHSTDSTEHSTEQLYKEVEAQNRASSHILLVGRPGSGKSEFLSFASKICTPSVHATGTGCTSAGLTACAVRENGDWVIEPGALPQADRGICCIDEFTQLKKEDKSSILEAMEQQTVTVAKAGILMRLETRCTLVGAARHTASERESILPSLKLPPPLVSRFDLILSLDSELPPDTEVARGIIEREADTTAAAYVREVLRRCKGASVVMTDACKSIIGKYYERQRRVNPSVTVRALESHIRLSEAHAKLMHRKTVLEVDALITALLLDVSLSTTRLWKMYALNHLLPRSADFLLALDHVKKDLLG
ncbi:DNA helicase MCM9 [Nematocida displodere]|uniref:DNA helicase n=1 Tax=Nematocida displodere TaxID=1805483 RepID=A0A177EJC4_9MICR|nr:DNA helicase MCM9 [Nematocida displodere]